MLNNKGVRIMKKLLFNLNGIVITIATGFFLASNVSADDSGDNSFFKEDGSLVIIRGAEDSGIIVKGTDDGMEQEYYVVPKDDGSKTFIYDEGLTVCDSTGCY